MTNQVDEEKNSGIPSSESQATSELNAAPPPKSLGQWVYEHAALIATLKRCLSEMRSAAELLDMFPDDYGAAINQANALLVAVDPAYAELDVKLKAICASVLNGQDTNTSASDGTT